MKNLNPSQGVGGIDLAKRKTDTAPMGTCTACSLGLNGEQQSSMITLSLTSADADIIPIPLGTPLGRVDEVDFYPDLRPKLIVNLAANTIWADAVVLANITDNQGVNATFLQAINRRFTRHGIYVNRLEVVTPDTALGQQQKAVSIQKIVVPYNSASDACVRTGKFVPQYTEYTGADVLNSEGAVVDEFNGIIYPLLAGSTVNMNIYIDAIDAPTFKKVY
jgi:hypothetical protein